ncbi:hypothetical protein C4559_03325 [Candidatus Microgenomates bacterium]|nr:MAG: hypothetical protein C4559_03325 [Candidatus Microgenomates bacterium]
MKRNNFTTIIFFIIIVVFSLIFRITNLDVIEFKADEGVSIFLASRPIFGHPFPPGASVSSVGILNSPLFNYALLPILLISLYPPTISFFIGLLNSIAIGVLFLIFKHISNLSIATMAALLMAFSPWSILFSRKIWNPDFLIIFFIPILLSLYKIIIQKKYNYWLLFTAFSLFIIQIHLPSIFFIFLILGMLIFSRTIFNFKYILIGLLIGFLPMIPYLLFQFSNDCPDCRNLFSVDNRFAVNHSFSIFLRPLQIVNLGNFQYVLGDDMLTFASKFPFIFQAKKIFYIEYLLLPLGALLFYNKFKKFNFLVIVSFLLPILYFLFRIEPLMHYFIAFSPLLFLFLATAFYHLFSYKNNYLKIITVCLFVSLIIESLLFNFAFFNILAEKKVLKGDYGTSFAISEKTTKEKYKKYSNSPNYNEIIVSSYVPKKEMYGFLPFPKIIFSNSYSKEEIASLEKQLIKMPDNDLIQMELLAYYTKNFPDIRVVKLLRTKNKQNPEFNLIYENVYSLYLEKNLRNAYSNDNGLKFSFEYPRHWKLKSNLSQNIIIENDINYISILTNPKYIEINPGEKLFGEIKINSNIYRITYANKKNSKTIIQESKDLLSTLKMIAESFGEE